MLMIKIAVPFPSLVTLVVLVALMSLSDGGVEILIMIVMTTLIKVRFSSVHSKALILLISSTPSSIFQKKKNKYENVEKKSQSFIKDLHNVC